MANPLPTPQLRYHSKHSKPSVTAPLSVSDLPLPPLPELKVGGFGLNLVELVELGVKLSKDPMGAFSDVLRAFGVDLASGLLDRLWDPLDDLLMYAWKGLNIAWPAFRDFMGLVQNVFENLLLSIYYRITGKLQNPGNPGRGDLRCECDTPTTEGKLDRRAYEALPFGTEISKRIITLIKELMPEVWTYRDDIPTTSVKYFVEGSKLRRCARYHKDSGRALDAYDVHDHIAQRGDLHDTAPPYTRAWKWNNSQLFVEVGFLRMYSFLPEGSTTSSYDTEHEGDGERMFMILDVLPVCKDRSKLRIHKIILPQHGSNPAYRWEHLRMHNNRAIVCVGRGGHGIYIGGGPWEPGTKWKSNFSVELAPSPGEDRAYGCANVEIAKKLGGDCDERDCFDEREYLYPDVQHFWGLNAVWKTNPPVSWFWAISSLGDWVHPSANAVEPHLSLKDLGFMEIPCDQCGKMKLVMRPDVDPPDQSDEEKDEKKPDEPTTPRVSNCEWIARQDPIVEDALIPKDVHTHTIACKLVE